MNEIQQLISAIAQSPNDPALHYQLGGLYMANNQCELATQSYLLALKFAPNHPQILLQLGNAASIAQRYQQALEYFKACIAVAPDDAAAHYNLGNTYRALGQPQLAAASYRETLTLLPNDADTYNNLGNVLRELGQLDQSIACYERALQLNPHLHHALVHLIHQKQHICAWNGLEEQIAQLRQVIKHSQGAQIPPFAFLSMPNTTAQEQLLCANRYATQQYGHLLNQQLPSKTHAKNKTIKIAYLSADFRLHPLAFLITDLFAKHHRAQFEVFAYSYGQDDASTARADISAAVDHFEVINALTDIEAAHLIKKQQIDILIDLTGYTQNSRTSIVALKPAPISINWLGYPGSMGKFGEKSLFDYVLVDRVIAPDENAFSEQCLYLPCYQPNNHTRPIAKISDKASVGLLDNGFVFCCFNQTFKITPVVFEVWMRLLKQVPKSVLWLLECNPWAKQNLIQAAISAGVSAERLVFAPRVAIAEHMARHVHADLFLDTLPYNAHTTASDALWMGLPMLTCAGDTFPSRVSASLLSTLNQQELITESLQAYEEKALFLANHPSHLLAIKNNLIQNKSLLFDIDTFVGNLETLYQQVYQAYQAKQS